MSDDLFLFAGEPSGDLHGEKLLQELYKQRPDLKVRGVGGPKMRATGMECVMKMEDFEVMGFTDVFSSLPKLYKQFKTIKRDILKAPPKGVVTIDYPGFNLRMAQALAKTTSPAKRIHYICPTVWAWGKRRIPKMERSLDALLTILPFEPDLFSKNSLHATYIGHPLIARIERHTYRPDWHQEYGIESEQPILSIYPGSRKKEILRNLPIQMKVAQQIQKENPDLTIALSCSQDSFLPLLRKMGGEALIVKSKDTYELMRASYLAIATSGTVTLELALHHTPTVVTFAINPLDVFLAKRLFRIHLDYYALPNILHQEELFPELFGPYFTEEALWKKCSDFMVSECKRSHCVEGCKKLKKSLGQKDASAEGARVILEMID